MTWWVPALVAGGMLAGYGAALRRRPGGLPPWPVARTGAWLLGVLAVVVALGPPLAGLVHDDHRAHMAQHLLLAMYAPLVLVLAAPVELVLAALPRAGARRLAGALRSPVVRVVAHPVTAALLDVGGLFVLYLTPLLEATATRPWLHALVLVHMLLAGCLFTWAVLGQGPGPRRPRLAVRLAVLVAAAGAHAYLATLLYARAEIHAHHDAHAATMQQAALWMYYGGDVAEILLAVALLAAWYRRGARRRPAPAAAVAT